jgi:Ca2+/Na+ antiporter
VNPEARHAPLGKSVIPITAVVRGGEGSDEVATGTIVGAPFLPATLAMGLVGFSAYLWRADLFVEEITLPISVCLAFTDWELDTAAVIACALALAGGLLAIFELQIRRRFIGRAIVVWAALFAVFVVYVATTA